MSSTWLQIKTEIENKYDLLDEDFFSATEMLDAANEAIDDIESEIHSIHEKYFETSGNIALVLGTSEYAKPSDMYANKVTGIYYNDGSTKYEIKPLKDKSDIDFVQDGDRYRYRFVNSTSGGIKIKLYPASQETSSTNVTIHYIRQAKHFALDADVLDIPEAEAFIKQYVVDQAANKERMTPDAPESAALGRKRKVLIEVLSTMVEDENSEIKPDLSFLEDNYFDMEY